jgi:protein-disulfide isomerase
MTMKRVLLLISLVCMFSLPSSGEEFKDSSYYLKELPTDLALGSKDVKVVIIEYSSMVCPHCADFYQYTFPSIKKEFIDTGKVRWIHRDFPVDAASLRGAMLLTCVPAAKLEAYLKVLYYKQSNWAFNKNYIELLENIAKLGGMTGEEFHQCINDRGLEERILSTKLVASKVLKLKATPAFFINGKKADSLSSLSSFVDEMNKLKK